MTYRLTDIYSAVAEKKRREILDLLRHEPLNVADVASRFDISRTAVEKHLKVLSDVGLISAKRVGREKVNHIEPGPLEEIWDWLTPYSAFWSDRLLELQTAVEDEPDDLKGEP
jgi:DNA-binding transcriptional ArsR family regulator